MKLLVRVRPENGHFVASLHGDDQFRAEGSSRDLAISSLLTELKKRDGVELENGDGEELIEIEWPRRGLMALAGSVQGEAAEALRGIVAEAYRLRDEEKAVEFPE